MKTKNADVKFLGMVANDQLPEVINRYPVFVLPTYFEGNPKVLLEAMSCAKAVVGADVAGVRELIRQDENGILCGNEVDELGSAVDRILKDDQLRDKLGKNARESILKVCTLDKVIQRELEIYGRLVH